MQIYIPKTCLSEMKWLIEVLFSEFLDLSYNLIPYDATEICLKYEGKAIYLPNNFFNSAHNNWLGHSTLPKVPLLTWNVVDSMLPISIKLKPLPVFFGAPLIEITDMNIRIDIDIFGTIFLMLSRYEEAVLPEQDEHLRFPACASLAFKEKFLERPIVDEYVEVLWAAIKLLWPQLKRKQGKSGLLITCDVDQAFVCDLSSFTGIIRRIGGDLIHRHSVLEVLRTIHNSYCRLLDNDDYSQDPYLQGIKFIMEANELLNNKVIFYFMAGSTCSFDRGYNLNVPIVRRLLREIASRGHVIGLHGSYFSYNDFEQLNKEKNDLERVLAEEKIDQSITDSRQHYLRFDVNKTPDLLDYIGIQNDSTMSYAQHAGFRCGTSKLFSMYSLAKREKLKIKQQPLIVMESSVIDDRYMGFGNGIKTLNYMRMLSEKCYAFNGVFTLLWHNTKLSIGRDKEIYQTIISSA